MDPDRSLESNCNRRLTAERPNKKPDPVAAEARQIGKNSTEIRPGVRL